MDGLIFDFDGVVVNSEPIHFDCFKRVLAQHGINLSRDDYYGKYLGYDDHDCFKAVFRDHGIQTTEQAIAQMTSDKTSLVQKAFGESIQALPGTVEIMDKARQAGIPIAICSGALMQEIELASKAVDARRHVLTIVSAEEVKRGKPDPEGYQLAYERLVRLTGKSLRAQQMVVIEDSPAGIAAGKAFGAKVLALTTSYEKAALASADKIVANMAEVSVQDLERMVTKAEK